ncbi:hypothetical protein ACQJBY_047178 [Aegilops geniculata]
MPPTTPVPSLPEELLEEVFLHLPPDEPEHLVRASLANKLWLGLLTGARFRGRYRDFHGAPPMLGFLYTLPFLCSSPPSTDPRPHFVSTTKFAARIPDDLRGYSEYDAQDCRHGRVLLRCKDLGHRRMLFIWNPMTGCSTELPPSTEYMEAESSGAAVLCAVTGCDHRACHEGPFRVIFVYLDQDEGEGVCVASAAVLLSDSSKRPKGKWCEPCSRLHLVDDAFIEARPPVLVQDALHFMLRHYEDYRRVGILKYDLGSNCLSLIDAPLEGPVIDDAATLMAMEDGSLGLAHVERLTLNLWSRQIGSRGVASWTQRAVVDLGNLLPIQNPKEDLELLESVEGSDTVFVTTDMGIYEINLKSLRWKKLWKTDKFGALIPYMSFYNR